jgi:hypothetical protein
MTKLIAKNPQNNPVINLRRLFETITFFNCNMPSIPNANTDKNVHINIFINANFIIKLEKIIPVIYPMNSPVQRAQTGN